MYTHIYLTFARCAFAGVWDKHGSIHSIGDDGHLMWGDSRTQHCVLLAEKRRRSQMKLFYPYDGFSIKKTKPLQQKPIKTETFPRVSGNLAIEEATTVQY